MNQVAGEAARGERRSSMSLTRRDVALARLFLVGSLAGITYLAATPGPFPAVFTISDKLNHLAAFLVLSLAADFSFPRSGFGLRKALPLLAYAFVIEAGQSLLPHRSADLWDIAADLLGMLLYSASVPFLRRVPILRRRWVGE
jgi:VanZ family protein